MSQVSPVTANRLRALLFDRLKVNFPWEMNTFRRMCKREAKYEKDLEAMLAKLGREFFESTGTPRRVFESSGDSATASKFRAWVDNDLLCKEAVAAVFELRT